MKSVSTPDAEQAEAYVATAALFLIFSHLPREEKVYLRLPSVWRDLWSEFSKSQREVIDSADRDSLRELRKLVLENTKSAEPNPFGTDGKLGSSQIVQIEVEAKKGPKGNQRFAESSQELIQLWSSKASTASFQRMSVSRKTLPISKYRDELLQAIEENQAVVVCGETGNDHSPSNSSELSTETIRMWQKHPSTVVHTRTRTLAWQTLQHLLYGKTVLVIQCSVLFVNAKQEPRRISAISLAQRVSEELGERKGDIGTSRSLAGYAIRLESRISPQTRLIYATTGIVMRMLERSDELQDITHLVLDEVHERTLDSDFLLIVLRQLMVRRPSLRVLLMSATVNAKRFSDYMGGAPILNVPGRTYPVETRYLEDAIEVAQYRLDSDTNRPEDSDDDEEAKPDFAKHKAPVYSVKGYSAATCSTLSRINEYRIEFDLIVRLLDTIATKERFASYSKAILVFLPGLAEIRQLNDLLAGHPTFRNRWYIYPLHSSIAMEEQEQAFSLPPDGVRKIVLSTNIAETGVTIPDVTCVIDTGKHREMRFDERRQLSRLIEVFISRANAKQRRGRAGRVQDGLCFHLFTKARHDNVASCTSAVICVSDQY